MRQKKDRIEEKGAIEIIEEATQLLRKLPIDIYALYFLGSLPFILGFLYFWADMSRGAFAYKYAAEAAFSMTALYIWMKCWQAVFCERLHANLLGCSQPTWTFKRVLRLIAVQTAIQPISFIALPVSSVLMLPFAWVYAFYHNVSVAGNGMTSDIRTIYQEAWQQARLFTAQNHIFIMLYTLFGIFVFFNLAIIVYLFPKLLSTFLGIETSFSRATWVMFNSTLLMAAIGGSYLTLNPLAKTVYVLRCFYGESLQTGADLRVELNSFAISAKAAVNVILLMVFISLGSPANMADGANNDTARINKQTTDFAISESELDSSMNEVISKREYSWRMPKGRVVKKEDAGIIGKFISGLIDTIKDWLKPVLKLFKGAIKWILDKLFDWKIPAPADNISMGNWMQSLRIVLYALIFIAALVLGFVLWRVFKSYQHDKIATDEPAAESKPNLSHDNTLADELPMNGWLKIAEDLMSRGDLRSAVRALYLASLSQLSRQKVIVIARFKSNKEYEQELYRKAHNAPELLAAFSGNMRIFEGIWYGKRQISDEALRIFKDNQTRITTIANRL